MMNRGHSFWLELLSAGMFGLFICCLLHTINHLLAHERTADMDKSSAIVKRQSEFIIKLCIHTNACKINLKTNEIEVEE